MEGGTPASEEMVLPDQVYAETFEIHKVGGKIHQELWVPAEELPEFNRHIKGEIEVVGAYYGDKFSVDRINCPAASIWVFHADGCRIAIAA